LTEKELIDALKKGDTIAFNNLVDTYSNIVYRICVGILVRKEDAEDVTQEVFTKIYLNIQSFQEKSKLSTWIYRIAMNQCNEHLRKASRKKRINKTITSDSNVTQQIATAQTMNPDFQLIAREEKEIVLNAINSLPEKYRIVLTLNAIDGISYKEVAETLNSSLTATESLLYRAKQQLKIVLSDFYDKNYN
jgi:RNA polymerase sigma-70 factor (ECF subfamily)